MRVQLSRWFKFLVIAAITMQWTLPAASAAPTRSPNSATSLLPAWYTDGDGPTDEPALPADPLPGWYSATNRATPLSTTALSVSKSSAPDPVNLGDLLTYWIAVTNETGEEAEQVVVTDVTPAGTTFESASVLQDGGATWFYGGLLPGQSGEFAWFTSDGLGIGGGLPGGTTAVLELVVRAVGPFPEPARVHNSQYRVAAGNAPAVDGSHVTTRVTRWSAAPETAPPPAVEPLPAWDAVDGRVTAAESSTTTLGVTKADSPDPVDQGHLLTYVITVTNQTENEAEQAVVTETTPAGTVFETARVLDDGGATWFGGGLSVGESGDYIWFTGDRIWPSLGGLPGNRAAVFELVSRVVGPFPDQDEVHNDHYLADADNAELVAGDDVQTVVNAPVFALAKVASDEPVTAGSRLSYTIYLTNTGHLSTSYPYTIVETLPVHTSYADSYPSAELSGDNLTWTMSAPLGIGQATSVTFAVTVTTPYTTGLLLVNDTYLALSNEVSPTSYGPAITTTVLSWPSLAVFKVDEPDPVEAGSLLSYTFVVANASEALATAEGTFVTDTLPSTVSFQACQPVLECAGSGQAVTWTLGTLAPGATRHLTLTVRVHRPLDSGTVLTNRAAVSATNALSTVETSAGTTVNSAPVLTVAKAVTPPAVTAGSVVTYTIVVTNTGNETASGATITDTLPGSFQFGGMLQGEAPIVNAAGNVLTWTNQTITPTSDAIRPPGWIGPPGPLTLIFTATTGISGTFYNVAAVTRGAVTATTGPTAAVVVDSPDLRLQKRDLRDPVEPGRSLTYTIVYSNASPTPATGVVITDELPHFITGGYASEPYDGSITPGGTIAWTIGRLDGFSGDRAITLVVTLTLPITDGTVLTNTAGITCNDGVGTTTGPITTTVESSPDMVLVKAAAPPIVSPNDLVTFTLAFSNVGTAAAPATVTDVLPISLTHIVSATTGNVSFLGAAHPAYTWTVSPLAPGQQGAITIAGRVMTTTGWGQSTRITNTAGIVASGESVTDNNVDRAAVDVIPGPPADITLTANPPATTVDCSSTVTAEVLDAWGNPVLDGTAITFTTGTAASGASPPAGFTSLGTVSTTVTATLPGSVAVTATAPNLASGTTSVVFSAGAPHSLVFAAVGDPQTAGVSFTIVLTAYDQHGNVSTGYTGPADLSDDTGTLSPTVSNSAVGGVLTQSVTITRAWASDVIDASASGTTACGDPWSAAGSSDPFSVVHNLAITLALAPQNATVEAGNTPAYTGIATDSYGNDWNATTEVTFTTSGGNVFLGAAPGNNVFSATTAGVDLPIAGRIAGLGGPLTGTTGITVTHGQAASLRISPRDWAAIAGDWITYSAVATDAFGNAWAATGDVTWAAGGGNQFTANVLSATIAGTWPVTGSLPAASDSTLVSITHGAVVRLAMAAVSDPQTAGAGFGLVITAHDVFDNVAAGFSGNLILSDTTATLVPTTWSAWSAGIANPTVTITRAWAADRITATLAATPTMFVVSNPFDVVGSTPSGLTYQAPLTMPICGQASVTATVTDTWGNPVADGTTVSLAVFGGGLVFAQSGNTTYNPTTVGGVATATLQAGTSTGSAATSASAGSVGPVWQTVNVVTPGLPSQVTLIAVPSEIDVISGTALLTATVRDCANNPVPDVDVTFGASFGSLQPPSGTTDLDGQVTASFSSTVAGTAAITATAGNVSGSAQVKVRPAQRQVFVPIVLHDYQAIGVNLVVESIVWQPTSPVSGQSVTITVTVRNLGTVAAGNFWVDLYLDPTITPTVGVLWVEICSEGVAWLVPGLGGGQSLALRSDQGDTNYTYWRGFFADTPNPHELWAVADSWLGNPTVVEDREDDNALGPEEVYMTGP